MAVVKASPGITVNSGNVVVDFNLKTTKHVYGHLTHNFAIKNDTAEMDHAWTAVGQLQLDSGHNDGADFGFVQLQRILGTGVDYVGKTSSDGSIRLTVSEAPALTQKLALDSNDAFSPWTKKDPGMGRFTFNAPNVKMETGDHPMIKVLKKLGNESTKKVNYLRSLHDKREFWTMLTMKNKDGTYTYLKHFHWKVSYIATFKWVSGDIILDSKSSSNQDFGHPKAGPPSDSTLATLLGSPVGPQANALMDAALTMAVANGRSNNRKDFDDGTCGGAIAVPTDFFA